MGFGKKLIKQSSAKYRSLYSILTISMMVVMALSSSSNAQRRIKIMPLGTSITAGGISDGPSYRYYVWKNLVDSGLVDRVDFVGTYRGLGNPDQSTGVGFSASTPPYKGYEWDADHNGIASVVIPNVIGRIHDLVSRNVPDIALLELGTNDLMFSSNPDTMASNMGKIIDSLRSYNPSVIVLLGKIIPRGTYDTFLVQANQKYADLAARKTTPQSPVVIVDQYTGMNPATMLGDGIHPNTSGEMFMSTKWTPALVPFIKSLPTAPTVSIKTSGLSVEAGKPVSLTMSTSSFFGVKNVKLYNSSTYIGDGFYDGSVYKYIWTPIVSGNYTLTARAEDYFGGAGSAQVSINATPGAILDKTIMEIQGSDPKSLLEGRAVRTTGVVTLVSNDSNSIWIQDPVGDNLTCTSDAIVLDFGPLHRAGKLPPAQGDFIRVVGVVQEYRTDLRDETLTRISSIDSIITTSTGNSLPQPLLVNNLPNGPSDGPLLKGEFEKREGMLIKFSNAIVTAPVNESGEWAVALTGDQKSSCYFSNSNGSFFINYPSIDGSVNYNTGCFLVGTSSLLSMPVVHSGDTVFECTGVLDYKNGNYLLQPLPNHLLLSAAKPVSSVPVGGGSYHTPFSIRVASINLGGFCDTLDAVDKNDVVLSSAEFNLRVEKIACAIKNEMELPEVICVQGVENQLVLTEISNRVNQAGSGRYKSAVLYSPHLSNCGFMYDSVRCSLNFLSQIDDSSFNSEGSVPLFGMFIIDGNYWNIINISLADRAGDDPLFGINQPPVRYSESLRNKQALAVRKYINDIFKIDPNEQIVVAGVFNDYPFNEAGELNNPESVIKGNAAKGEIVMRGAWESCYPAAPWNWYTELNKGRFQMTSDILVSPFLLTQAKSARVMHFNAGFDQSFFNVKTSTIKAFKDDPVEVRF